MWSELLGGLGFFLVGMMLMTDGLRHAAGDRFVSLLRRLTHNRLAAVGTGVGITALLQSSSATTLTTIGLVSAGVMSFPASVGVIFGANIGTTATSWLVATIGLKFKIAAFAFPMVGIGALVSLLGRGSSRDLGTAVAGFGMIFVGIDFLQTGMQALSGYLDPSAVPVQGIGGTLLMVLLGLVMTVVMQSSSAAVATTLTALASGAIGLEAAAAMVIGQNVGTTVTAAIGSVGATTIAKRTALAHVLFNVVTAAVALLLLPFFIHLAAKYPRDATEQIAIFHTAFNVLGVTLLLPFLDPYCRLVERIVPDKALQFANVLDESTLAVPAVAVAAVRTVALKMLCRATEVIRQGLDDGLKSIEAEVQRLTVEYDALAQFSTQITTDPQYPSLHAQHISTVHAIDHLRRVLSSAAKPVLYATSDQADVVDALVRLDGVLEAVPNLTLDNGSALVVEQLEDNSRSIADLRRGARERVLANATSKKTPAVDWDTALRKIGRIDRVGYHVWRCAHHLTEREMVADIEELSGLPVSADGGE